MYMKVFRFNFSGGKLCLLLMHLKDAIYNTNSLYSNRGVCVQRHQESKSRGRKFNDRKESSKKKSSSY